MGIISKRKASGTDSARRKSHPRKRTINPDARSRREIRARKSSAPNCPTMRTHKAKAKTNIPDHAGFTTMRRKRSRSCQAMKMENSGTKKPWEKLGSCHHWPTRWVRVGAYSQRESMARTANCHQGSPAARAGAGRTVSELVCANGLTETLHCPGETEDKGNSTDCATHSRAIFNHEASWYRDLAM